MSNEIRKFDRHANMDAQTREKILELIQALTLLSARKGVETFSTKNFLYGFFDGYDYSNILPENEEAQEIKEKDFDLYLKILGVCYIVSKYPDGSTQI